jgi:hypothetical protein
MTSPSPHLLLIFHSARLHRYEQSLGHVWIRSEGRLYDGYWQEDKCSGAVGGTAYKVEMSWLIFVMMIPVVV